MRVLVDTHAFLWFVIGDTRLPDPVRDIVENPDNDRFVSVVSCWEIAIKFSLGRLKLAVPIDQLFGDEIEGNGLISLGIERRHLLEIPRLPAVHGDPFDRLLIAQAKVNGLILVSNDATLDGYGINRFW